MARTLLARLRDPGGFSLIELLVVMLVIAIVAAIAIPAFLGQNLKAYDASAKNDARRLAGMVQECKLDKSSFKDCNSDNELDDTPGLTWGNGPGEVRVVGAQDDEFEAEATSHARSGNKYHVFSVVRNPDGTTERVCTVQGGSGGGCSNGSW